MPALIVVLLVALGQAPQPPSSPAVQPPHPAAERGPADYVVGPHDVLSISVYGVPELSRDVTIDQDGTFDYPMLGRIAAGGKGVRQIEDIIKSMLVERKYFAAEPSVTVDVKAYRSQSVWVMGAVRTPGEQKITGNASVMSVLAEAGFNTKSAPYILLTHRPKNAHVGPVTAPTADSLRIDRRDLESGRAQNVRLQDGDTIWVPEPEKYTISGFVHSPGWYEIDGEVTVLQALAQAGGATEQAAQNRIEIHRMQNGKLLTIRNVKLTDLVKAGDTIVVPRRRM